MCSENDLNCNQVGLVTLQLSPDRSEDGDRESAFIHALQVFKLQNSRKEVETFMHMPLEEQI